MKQIRETLDVLYYLTITLLVFGIVRVMNCLPRKERKNDNHS